MGKVKKDLIGLKFGNLTVISEEETQKGNRYLICKCDCGNTSKIQYNHMQCGRTISCGCMRDKRRSESLTTHGDHNTKLYNVWCAIKRRCNTTSDKAYSYYGGRGIRMCTEWEGDYPKFKEWAIRNGYGEGLSIDRINNNGNYEPNNCRWADMITQLNNTSKNKYISDWDGSKKTIAQLARKYNINRKTLTARINRNVPISLLFSNSKISV